MLIHTARLVRGARLALAPALSLVLAATFATASRAAPPAAENPLLAELPADSVTHHQLAAAASGAPLGYTATAGTLTLRGSDGKPTARVFAVSYVADGAAPSRRPVSFFFNGGPGAGTAYLHLGAAGPVALVFPPGHDLDGAGARLAANPDSWLRFSDLVFIDAVGTGYSLPLDHDKAAKQFWGVAQDGAAFADAIRIWLEHHGRTSSPKYLVGESYGGVRSIETAWALQQQQNIILDGIVMISPAIDEQLLLGIGPVGDAIEIPAFAAARLDATHALTPAAWDDAYRYAMGPYLIADANALLTGAAADAFYAKLAAVTGLPEAIVRRERGSIDPEAHDVRSRGGRLYSMYDATQSIADPYPEGDNPDDSPDPVLSGYGRAYGNAFTSYVGDTLGWRTELRYELLNEEVNKAWEWKEGQSPVAATVPKLRKLLALDPSLRVFVAHGYFDTVCPAAGTKYIMGRIPVGADRIRLAIYPGGHMLYTRPASRAALARDVGAFYAGK